MNIVVRSYVNLIKKGLRTLDEVKEPYRTPVEEALRAEGYFDNESEAAG